MRTFSRAVLAALAVLIFTPIFVSPSLAQGITAGDILVADLETGTIRRYSASGAEAVPPFASGLSAPWSITTDQLGNIYVSERDGQRVTKFSPAGVNLLTITTGFTPGGIRVGTDGTIYVVEHVIDPLSVGGKINRYSADGAALGSFATALLSADFMTFDAQGDLYVTGSDSTTNSEVVRRFSPTGAGLGDFVPDFFAPAGLAFDPQGNLYVASSTSNIVQKYDPSGNTGPDPFASGDPGSDSFRGIGFDAFGNLYVASSASGKIFRFPPGGCPPPGIPCTTLELFAMGLGLPWDLVIATVAANPPPVNPTVKDDCKQDGWELFDPFKNQGDCIQFVNTGK
jgi:streptogramin lyase